MNLKKMRRQSRREYSYDPHILARKFQKSGLWEESEEEIEAALKAARERDLLLNWVRREMRRRLTKKERRYLEARYLSNQSVAALAQRYDVHLSTVYRTIRSAIRKLKQAAQESNSDTPEDALVVEVIKRKYL
ncbi:MAG: sigma-70 family RNA polymerase sigma factor [Candidatus Hydrogenedentes bacterium]|nr:sigma-70 family RNA polymerase sigma factor [Candidatus Hydrogenedentota bacterium]